MLYGLTGLLLIKGLSFDTEVLLQKARKFIIIGSSIMLLIGIIMLVFEDPSERVVRAAEAYLEAIALWQGNYWYQTMIHAGFSIAVLILSPSFIYS
jgi:uncharacterized protein